MNKKEERRKHNPEDLTNKPYRQRSSYSQQGTHFWVCITFCRVRHGDSVTKPDYYYYYYYYYYFFFFFIIIIIIIIIIIY